MKMRILWWPLLVALLISVALSENFASSEEDTCPAQNLWSDLLEEWATSSQDHDGRHGRVMALPPTKGYYVTERIDGPLTPPPLPPQGHSQSSGPYGPPSGSYGLQSYGSHPHGVSAGQHSGHGGSQAPQAPNRPQYHASQPTPGYSQYDEWKATPPPPPNAGKIVNRPPNPYKDKFKPSYQVPNQPIPVAAVDRVDASPAPPPPKQVSETDLYLLTAIEKLVYRADLMEKRLRRLEDSVHYLVAGKEAKPEPCAGNFSRVGGGCYQVSAEALDWKAASLRCRKVRAHLLELDSDQERRALTSTLMADNQYRGKDLWTGGLNPGLLWIWSHSAKPVNGSETAGEGRCLALVPTDSSYIYRGQDCALRHRYICELPEDRDKLSNEIERVAKELTLVRTADRKAKILWERL